MASHKHKIYFVRHGQCKANVTGETLSPEEDVITDIGIKQSEILGEHLKDVQFSKGISSTYPRSIDTAKAMISKMNKEPEQGLILDSRMKEREMGTLTGQSAKQVFPQMLKFLQEGQRFNEIEIPEAETVKEYEGRIRNFFKDLFEEFRTSEKPQAVFIVSHGLTMRRFFTGITNTFADICTVSNWSPKATSVIKNTAYTEMVIEFPVESEKPVMTFEKIHYAGHLEAFEKEMSSLGNNNKTDDDHDISKEQKRLMIEEVMKIPYAKEDLSGLCVQM